VAAGPGREGRPAQGASLPPLLRRALCEGAAPTTEGDRRARPHEGAGRRRRTALSGRSDRHRRGAGQGRRPFAKFPRVIGGRYGLSSKEFTPAHGQGRLRRTEQGRAKEPLHHRHHRRRDHTSLDYDPPSRSSRRMWCARSSGAWAPTARWAPTRTRSRSSARRPTTTPRATFVYDSKKSGARTVSHLRFGPKPIHSTYLIQKRQLCRRPSVRLPRSATTCWARPTGRRAAAQRPYPVDEVWDNLPRVVQEQIIAKKLKLYVIDAYEVAADDRHGRAHQHRSCRPASSPSAACCRATRPSPDQGVDQEDLRQARRGRGEEELRRGR
jgi:hypothetical protein